MDSTTYKGSCTNNTVISNLRDTLSFSAPNRTNGNILKNHAVIPYNCLRIDRNAAGMRQNKVSSDCFEIRNFQMIYDTNSIKLLFYKLCRTPPAKYLPSRI